MLFGFVAPRALEIVYIAWMSLAFTMGLLRNHTFTGKDIEKPYYLVMGNYMLDKRDQPKFTEEADWKTEFKLD